MDEVPDDQLPRLLADIFRQLRAEWEGSRSPDRAINKLAAADILCRDTALLADAYDVPLDCPLWWIGDRIVGATRKTGPGDLRSLAARTLTTGDDRAAELLRRFIKRSLAASPHCASLVVDIIEKSRAAEIADRFAEIRGGICG